MFRTSLTAVMIFAILPVPLVSAQTNATSIRRSPQVIDVNPAGFEEADSGTITIHRGSRRPRDTGRWTAASGTFNPAPASDEGFYAPGDCDDAFLSGVAATPLP